MFGLSSSDILFISIFLISYAWSTVSVDAPFKICTNPSEGYNQLHTDTSSSSMTLPASGEKIPINETSIFGYDSAIRQLLFHGNFLEHVFEHPLDQIGYEYDLFLTKSTEDTIHLTKIGECDIGWAGLTKTVSRERCDNTCLNETSHECCVDFTSSVQDDSLGILYKMKHLKEKSMLLTALEPPCFNLSCQVIVYIFAAGHIIWFLERKDNSIMFPTGYLDGIDDGIWWALVTGTTVGYGDKVPITKFGRLFGFFWMFCGLLMYSYYIGLIASVLVSEPQEGANGIESFYGQKVCTNKLYANTHLNSLPVTPVIYDDIMDCFEDVKSDKVKAVYYERSILDYHILHNIDLTSNARYYTTGVRRAVRFAPVFRDQKLLSPSDTHDKNIVQFRNDLNGAILEAYEENLLHDISDIYFKEAEFEDYSVDESYDWLNIFIMAVAGTLFIIKVIIDSCKDKMCKKKKQDPNTAHVGLENHAHMIAIEDEMKTLAQQMLQISKSFQNFSEGPQKRQSKIVSNSKVFATKSQNDIV